MHHYLRPLIAPESVALVGASERAGSLGCVVLENLLSGGFRGAVYPVNPRHRAIRGQVAYPTLAAIGKPVDLAIVATPPHAVIEVLESMSAGKVGVAIVMTAPSAPDRRTGRAWSREVAAAAKRSRVRVIGPGALGVVRPGIGLNATYCAPAALPGRLALVAQSGAVATALLDFATPLGIGFSTVISLGGGIDVGFGELLDCLLLDLATDGILLYVEEPGDARAFVSALRAAARVKPVVVLKAGRSIEGDPETDVPADAVFGAAMMRAGTVRVQTYTQLVSAARILARGRIPQGDRLAIVSNGRGPALLAADSASDRRVRLATFTGATVDTLQALTVDDGPHGNPVDVRGDTPTEKLAAAVDAALSDSNVDVVVALHVPRPSAPAIDAARALAEVAQRHSKPVLAAWLGAIDRQEVHDALEAGGVPNFYTPENAVEALSFLLAYRNNQALLLEVPPPQPEPEPPNLAAIEALRAALADDQRRALTVGEALTVLRAFGIGAGFARVATLQEAEAAAGALRFPLLLRLDAEDRMLPSQLIRVRRSLHRAWHELQRVAVHAKPAGWTGRIVMQEAPREREPSPATVQVVTDAHFGPVIALAPAAIACGFARSRSLALPPINERLAADMIMDAGGNPGTAWLSAAATDALVDVLTRVSALVCALPWVRRLDLDSMRFEGRRAFVVDASFSVDPRRRLQRGYPHMAIHPYPVELIGDVALRDGTVLHLRPIRPEDAELERAFVGGLSEQSRYYRFFYRFTELTPSMVARFTQVDYDRELALVAIASPPEPAGRPAFVGVARYIANPDQTSAEFAVVVADDWQRRGVATVLMRRLIGCAKRRGFGRLTGVVLRENESMLMLVRSLGFALEDGSDDPTQVNVTLALA
ncbi:MAG: GNAT family N-acetyltransferase [Betaproteobacteria bacterium]|nr:GNAT family N-acetyltransferase [Betaproteobacteria bacterium]